MVEEIDRRLETAQKNFAILQQKVKELETSLAKAQNELCEYRTKMLQCHAVICELESQKKNALVTNSRLDGSVLFSGFYKGIPGWCNVNRDMMKCIIACGKRVTLDPYFSGYNAGSEQLSSIDEAFFDGLIGSEITGNELFINSAATNLLKPLSSRSPYKIAFTMFESVNGIPKKFADTCNLFSEIWVPSSLCAEIYKNFGVVRPIYVMPIGVDRNRYRPVPPLTVRRDICTFGATGWVSHRKGFDVMVKAFCEAFTDKHNVRLLLKPYYPWGKADDFIESVMNITGSYSHAPEVIVIKDILPQDSMASFYSSLDWIVCTSRGEGYFLPGLEAMSCGVPMIYPKELRIEYATEENSIAFDGAEITIASNAMFDVTSEYKNMYFIQPSVQKAAEAMQQAYELYLADNVPTEEAIKTADNFSVERWRERIANRLDNIFKIWKGGINSATSSKKD